jgi:hypothetical protein
MRRFAALALLAVVLGGLIWWVQSYRELWCHIMPGPTSQVTSSTAPYEVVLRVASKSGKLLNESVPPMEWVLHVPRTYVTRELGKNGVAYRRAIGGGDEYFVDFQANVSADGKTFSPTAGRPANEQIVRSMIFDMRNIEAAPAIRNFDSCVPQHMRKAVFAARGYPNSYGGNCYDRDLRCEISMQVDGWEVDLAVTRDLYADPENACRLARRFLDAYTVRRDDIR